MNLLKKIIMIVVLLPAAPLFAQFDFPMMGSAGAAMGGTSVALSDDESALYNVAGIARIKSPVASIAFRQCFLFEGTKCASVAAASPLSFGAVGVSFLHYGNPDYNEQMLSLDYAMSIGPELMIGVAFHYLHSGTSDGYYDPQNLFTFSSAVQYSPSDKLTVGFKAFNPILVRLRTNDEIHSPTIFNIGFSYMILDELLAVVEAEKNLYFDPTLRFGLEYSLNQKYAFRIGFNTRPVIYSFGIGSTFGSMNVALSAQVHTILGVSPHLSVYYTF